MLHGEDDCRYSGDCHVSGAVRPLSQQWQREAQARRAPRRRNWRFAVLASRVMREGAFRMF